MRSKKAGAFLAVLALALLISGPARPADPSEGAISPSKLSIEWSGHFTGAANVAGTATASCFDPVTNQPTPSESGPLACDSFALAVTGIAPGVFGSSVSVLIDELAASDDVDLEVYERAADGSVGGRVDGSANGAGESESVEIPEPQGSYYVFVIGFTVANGSYHGKATLRTPKEVPGPGRLFEPKPLSKPLFGIKSPGDDPDRQRHFVEAHDGVDLFVETWLPTPKDGHKPPAKLPTILVMTPYSDQSFAAYGNLIRYFVPRGYAVSQHHVRGTGESGGCLEQTGPNQIDDGARVVEYLGRDAPWASGVVGAYGASYDAETQISVAGLGDPARTKYLKAIVPTASVAGQYEYSNFDGVPYLGQALASNGGYFAGSAVPYFYAVLFGETPSADALSGLPGRVPRYPGKVSCQPELFQGSLDTSGDLTPFWQEREYRPGAEKVRAATLMVHGLVDFNVLPIAEAGFFERIPASTPHKGLFGIWEHAFPSSHSIRPEWNRNDWLPMVLAWFDRYLKGLPSGVESWPAVQVQGNDGQWRAEPNWPTTGGPVGQLALGPAGKLGVALPTGVTSYVEHPVAGLGSAAVFESAKLPARLEITGQPVLDVYVSLDQPDAHFVAQIETFDAAGEAIPQGVGYGMRSARHLDPLIDNAFVQAEGKAPPVDTPMRVSIRFLPTDLVIPKGGTVRVTLSGALGVGRGDTYQATGGLVSDVLPSGSITTVTVLHDCKHPSALRFLTARSVPDLLKVHDAREAVAKPAPAAAAALPVANAGGLVTAPVCGRAPLRLANFGPAINYLPPSVSAPSPSVKKPDRPRVLGTKTLPATGLGDLRIPGAALLIAAGSLGLAFRRRRAAL